MSQKISVGCITHARYVTKIYL